MSYKVFLNLKLFTILLLINLARTQRVLTRETSACEGRQSPGPICETCDLLATCVRHSNGWINIPVETCDTSKGYYCNARLGMCSNMTGPCHPFGYEGNFPCTSHGIFPDPYDCQKYHMCYFVGATLVSATVECGNDRAFDAATGQCSLTLDNAICQQRQYECVRAGDARPWPSSANIFYVCKATSNADERLLYPTLYRCDDGDTFDGYYCLSANSTTISTSTDKGSNISTEQLQQQSQKCTKQGLFADKDNCRKYYYCSAVNGQLRHMECPQGTYYSAPLSSCVIGFC